MRTFKQHLTELSKKTLGSYVKKASKDAAFRTSLAHSAPDSTKSDHNKLAKKRFNGIDKATDKLTKEETISEGPIGSVKKGQMHKDLHQSADHKETSADIAKEKAKGGVYAKRAVFAQNAKKWHHEGVDMTNAYEEVLASEVAVENIDPLSEVKVPGTNRHVAVGSAERKSQDKVVEKKKKEKPFRDAAVTGKSRDFKNEEVEQVDEVKADTKFIKSTEKWKEKQRSKTLKYTPANKKPMKEETLVEEHDMSDAAHELVLHADNSAQLHHGSHMPIIHNLKKKMKKGTYDSEKAKKLWHYHADRAAQDYHKHYGDKSQPWHKMFSTHDRKQAASHWEAHHRDELKD